MFDTINLDNEPLDSDRSADPDTCPFDGLVPIPDQFIDRTVPDLPNALTRIGAHHGYYHSVARGVVASAMVPTKDSVLDPSKCSELVRWLVAVTRWRARLKHLQKVYTFAGGKKALLLRLARLLRCAPPGVRFPASYRSFACGMRSCCLFCYARACGAAHEQLARCLDRRPAETRHVYVTTRTYRVDAGHDATVRLFKRLGCAGGLVCKKPIRGPGKGVLVGVGAARHTGSVRLDHETAKDTLAAELVGALKVTRRYMDPGALMRRFNKTLFRDGPKEFAVYGLCRESGSGFGRDALRYSGPGGRVLSPAEARPRVARNQKAPP